MITTTEEPQLKMLDFESLQNRVEQIRSDIAAANQAAKEEEVRYPKIPADEKGKCLAAINKHRTAVDALRKGISFEQAEILLDGFMKKVQVFRQEFESKRNQGEQLIRDIAAAEKMADEHLSKYHEFLHDGEKTKADKSLVSVSEYRKKADSLKKQILKLSLNELKRGIENLQGQISLFIETRILLDIKQRLQYAFNMPAVVDNNLRHTLQGITKLEDFIKKSIESDS